MSAFGVPITDETLKAMSRYREKTITQEDKAREAMRLIHADSKNINALQHTLDLKKDYDSNGYTMCMFYNATGNRVKLVPDLSPDFDGSVFKEAPADSFDNGQWIAFLHKAAGSFGSSAARVYRADIVGNSMDYLVLWYSAGSTPNFAHTKVVPSATNSRPHLLTYPGKVSVDESDAHCRSTVSIGGNKNSECIAILQHKFPPLPCPTID